MKTTKRTIKISTKDLISKFFMKSPIPMVITRVKDGTYVEVNEVAAKFMGLPRKKIIGHKSTELGHTLPEKRKLYIDAIRKQGFANNVTLKLNIRNQGIIYLLYSVYLFKIRKESFFLSIATDVSIHQPIMGKFRDDIFLKIVHQDSKFVTGKLKQYKLTPRQQEIAVLSTIGHSNGEIARKLSISGYTVKDHLKEIFRIIGISNRSELFPKLLNLR